jgi:hypothetical protein
VSASERMDVRAAAEAWVRGDARLLEGDIVREQLRAWPGLDIEDRVELQDVHAELRLAAVTPSSGTHAAPSTARSPLRVVGFEEFVSADEHTEAPLLGSDDKKLLPAGSSLVFYGEGGSGKTTLALDMAVHLAGGADWLGFTIAEPVNVMLLENEGPRAEYRLKLRRKRDTWTGPPFADRVAVHEEPWGRVDLRSGEQTAELAGAIRDHGVTVLIAGPIRRLGLEGGGTPAETVAFMRLLDDVRELAGSKLAIVLVHHENKGGDISGAFEAEFDTVVHVRGSERNRTELIFRKSRWSSRIHRSRFTLAWIPESEGFTIVQSNIDEDAAAAARNAEDEAALDWLLEHATAKPGLSRGLLEKAYCDAHLDTDTDKPARGARARARRVIDQQIELAVRFLRNPSTASETASALRLAVRNGEGRNVKYVYPARHADSPLAEHLNGEHGEQVSHPRQEPPLASSPFRIEGTANGEYTAARVTDDEELEWR